MIESLLQAERLLVVGQVDAAEKIYTSTLAADPRNSIAMVGLARVALERDDDKLAYQHACEALEIDRQNAAALRLEARLSEVLTTRGEPVQRPPWLTTGEKPPKEPTRTAAPKQSPQPAKPAEAADESEPAKRRGLFDRILRR
jgi:thioredoxin-like negative regulator of GroEL